MQCIYIQGMSFHSVIIICRSRVPVWTQFPSTKDPTSCTMLRQQLMKPHRKVEERWPTEMPQCSTTQLISISHVIEAMYYTAYVIIMLRMCLEVWYINIRQCYFKTSSIFNRSTKPHIFAFYRCSDCQYSVAFTTSL